MSPCLCECSVDHPAEDFLAVSKNGIKLILSSKNPFLFFLITFLWTRRMRWLQPRWRVVDERPKLFRSKYKNGKKYIIQKTDQHKVPIISVNAVLTTPPKLSLQSPRTIKNLYFFRNIHFLFFLITFLWTRRMQWLQLRRKFLTKGRKLFGQCRKTLKEHITQKIDLHKNPIVSVNAVLTTPPKLSLQSPRKI